MSDYSTRYESAEQIIDGVEVTGDTLTGRGGLSLFVRYLRGIGVYSHLERLFGSIRRSRKGKPICCIFKQLFCFFVDGTSRRLVYFDALREDPGYAGAIELRPGAMVSSHAVKRFFGAFWWPRIFLFRWILQRLFLWRLNVVNPKVIELGLDTMVMDNDDAQKRHGVKPTYKSVKGFQPLQMTWDRFVIDAVFRGGDKHSNHSDTVQKMVCHVVKKIRKHYFMNVPIIIRIDSGFFDQKLFKLFEELGIGYICSGKLYDDLKEYVSTLDVSAWDCYRNGKQTWNFVELGDRRGSWARFRRAVFCRPLYEDRQLLFEFARPDTVLYTNLGMGGAIDDLLDAAGASYLMEPRAVIKCYHDHGRDELVHRALKEFGSEQLPFKRFAQNAAYYYTMLTAFFLYEAFKEDVCSPVIKVSAYATTLRRKIIDIAAKIVCHAGKIIIKVTDVIWNGINFNELWERSGNPPRLALT